MLWLPALCIRRYLLRRCAELGIALPSRREEHMIIWKVRSQVYNRFALERADAAIRPTVLSGGSMN